MNKCLHNLGMFSDIFGILILPFVAAAFVVVSPLLFLISYINYKLKEKSEREYQEFKQALKRTRDLSNGVNVGVWDCSEFKIYVDGEKIYDAKENI